MDKVQLIQRLMVTFREELEEHVRAFNRDLLALEKNPPAAERALCLKALFRTAHSLKGAARSVNVTLIESACHRMEGILERVRDGVLELGPDLYRLFFAVVDGIEEAGMRLREQHHLSDAPLAALLPRLDAASMAVPPEPAPAIKKQPMTASAIATDPAAASVQKVVFRSAKERSFAERKTTLQEPLLPVDLQEPAANEPAVDSGSVRVSAEKLDTLLGRIGELLVARRSIQSRVAELAVLEEFVEHWENDWRRVAKLVDRKEGMTDEGRGMKEDGSPFQPSALIPHPFPKAALVLRQNGQRLRRLKKDLERLAVAMKRDSRLLEQVVAPLQDEVHAVRMLPFAEACAGLDRAVRDLAQAGGKEVDLRIEGGAVELDRSILEGLKDPLRHLIRNAVDHGIEPLAQRRQAGKNRRGRIVVAASLRGSQVEVAVRDDGRGLDLDALRAQARAFCAKEKLPEPVHERDVIDMIFQPGFTTASIITDVSGRGVGLDVVKSKVEALHGTVEVSFQPGRETRFTLTVPLTLTTLRAALVSAGGQTFAFAGTNVHKFVRASAEDLHTVAGREMLTLGGQPLPFAHLSAVLGTSGPGPVGPTPERGTPSLAHRANSPTRHSFPVLVVAAGEKRMAFAVDEFLAEQEILVKNLGVRIRRVPLAAGATLLPSGKIALVLNGANLVRSALGRAFAPRTTKPEGPAPAVKKRLLVVEDSVTTRTLEKSILEGAGYEVATAVDGQAAWEFLQDHQVDLIVSDVEMPNMDGFELARTVRASSKLRAVPLILVTARETDQDRAQGIAVGADAYLVKSGFDQRNLLETIAQLL